MNHLIKCIYEYKKNKSDDFFEAIIINLKGLIHNHCLKIELNEREDLEQELLICLYKAINSFTIKDIRNIEISKFSREVYQQLVENDFKNIREVFKNNYINCFIDKYGEELFCLAFMSKENFTIFLNEFTLFCNENQFIKYIDSAFNKTRAYYKRKNKTGNNLQMISLNTYTSNGIELLDTIKDLSQIKNEIIDYSKLPKKDIEFLKSFIEGNRMLTEKEVAIKRGVSQQAVHSMFKRIANRLKK